MCASKKGMSAHQLHRMLGITYKTAWHLGHRIRYAMAQEPLPGKLSETVEVDETYIGGKEKGKRGMPGPDSKKTPVVSMVERSLVKGRKSQVRSQVMERVTLANIRPALVKNIAEDSNLQTDDAVIYYFASKDFAEHDVVVHKRKEYARREGDKLITSNTVEGYFSILKRGVHGTYHHVSRKHLHRYLSEFDFRYNARHVADAERAIMALLGADGKRLTYRDSLSRA